MLVAVKLAVVATVVGVLQAAPPHQPPLQPSTKVDFTGELDDLLQGLLDGVADPYPFNHILTLDVGAPGETMDFHLTMDNTTLAGLKNLSVTNAQALPLDMDISITVHAPYLHLSTPAYIINGTMVNHINLKGEGPAEIIIENLDLILVGFGNFVAQPLSVQFTNVFLDLELWRWTVNFEGMMPGTDLGTVFNEFLSMSGPELMDMIENNINDSDKLLNFINNILPH